MEVTPESLPEDVVELRAAALRLITERDLLLELNTRLQHIIDKMRRLQFGKRSEKIEADQLQLGLEDLEQAAAALFAKQDKADPGGKAKRASKNTASRPSRELRRNNALHALWAKTLFSRWACRDDLVEAFNGLSG